MPELCHRCHAELPNGAAGVHRNSNDLVLFCPHCGAPQLLLQDHMRIEDPAGQATTGMLPPPRVGQEDGREIDWRTALRVASGIAVLGAVFILVGLQVNAVAFVGFCWLLSGAVISVMLYSRQRPQMRTDGRAGWRIGLVTGLLMLVALGVGGAATGVVLRFGNHGLAEFDRQSAEQSKVAQAWAVRWMQEHNEDKEVQDRYLSFVNSPVMTSPEMRAGTELAQLALQAMLLLLVSSGGGAFAGALQGRRRAAMRVG